MADQIASKLREWRSAKGMTLAAAAEIFGLPPAGGASRVKRYEDGTSWAPAQVIDAIERATGGDVTAEDLKATRLAHIAQRPIPLIAPHPAPPAGAAAGSSPTPAPNGEPAAIEGDAA